MPEARHPNNPTRNGVPCGVADAAWGWRAEGTLLLNKNSVVKDFLTTAADGKDYHIRYYNLDVIISVGYRVKNIRGTQFRQWANSVLKNYLLRGYAVIQRIEQLEQRVTKTEEQIGFSSSMTQFITSAHPSRALARSCSRSVGWKWRRKRFWQFERKVGGSARRYRVSRNDVPHTGQKREKMGGGDDVSGNGALSPAAHLFPFPHPAARVIPPPTLGGGGPPTSQESIVRRAASHFRSPYMLRFVLSLRNTASEINNSHNQL